MRKLTSHSARNRGVLAVCAAIVLALGVIAFDSYTRYTGIHITSTHNLGTPPPAIDPQSPTGYELGMRRLVLPQSGVDGLHWIMHSQKLLAEGGWRIRHTDNDNFPEGREIHWSHAFIWWLIGWGKIHSLVTGLPHAASVEAVAPWANTIFLLLLVLIVPWIVYRRLGVLPACVLALGMVSSCFFFEYFFIGYPDHHGLAAAGALLCLLFIGLGGSGWIRAGAVSGDDASTERLPLERGQARRYFLWSAFAGSFCLWISAATAVPALAGIALGAVVSGLAFSKAKSAVPLDYDPSLWRYWGICGCVFSLLFYLLECFPGHMGMRLEVNHPLYALAFLGGGELLARAIAWKSKGAHSLSGNGKWAVPLSLVAVCLLPAIVFFWKNTVFLVSDPFLWALHKDYIGEFKGLTAKLADQSMVIFLPVLIGIPLVVLASLRLLANRKLSPALKSELVLGIFPGLLLTSLAIMQIRWTGIAHALWLGAIPVSIFCAFLPECRASLRGWEKSVFVVALVIVGSYYPVLLVWNSKDSFGKYELPSKSESFGMVIRDISHRLKRAYGNSRPLRVLGGPTTTTWMMYYGGMKGLGTLYWENIEGLKAAASIYNARTEPEALELVKQHGVTHLAIFSNDPFVFQYPRLLRGLPVGSKPADAFVPRILDQFVIPHWMQPLYCPMPDLFKDEWVCLYEFKPEQTEAEWHLAFARFYSDRFDHRLSAERYSKSLALEPNQPDVRIEFARALYLAGDDKEGEHQLTLGLQGKNPDEVSQIAFLMGRDAMNAFHHRSALNLALRALKANPEFPDARHLAAWLMATSADIGVFDPQEALRMAEGNMGLRSRVAFYDCLAAAQAANGAYPEAAVTASKAIESATQTKESPQVIEAIEARLDGYRSGKRFLMKKPTPQE